MEKKENKTTEELYEETYNTTLELLGRIRDLSPYNNMNLFYLLNLYSNPTINLNNLGEGIYADQIIDIIELLIRQKELMNGVEAIIKDGNISNLAKLNVFLADYICNIAYANCLVINLSKLGYTPYMIKEPAIKRTIYPDIDPEIGVKLDIVLN